MMRKTTIWRALRLAAAAVMLMLWGAAFSGLVPLAAVLMGRTQFVPALLRLGIALPILLALTVVFGRFYCSVLCPLGLIQDLVRWPFPRKKAVKFPNVRWLRLLVCGVALGLFGCGWATGFLWFDPYSVSGRIAGDFLWGGAVTLAALVVLTIWKPRWFCNCLCPAGTILGAASRFGVFRLTVDEKCVRCGMCLRNCPTGAIDLKTRTVDNERCVRCLACVAVCPSGAIEFHRGQKSDLPEFSRRKFLVNSGVFLIGCAAGAALAKSGAARKFSAPTRSPILPPGAGSIDRFAAKCTGCQLCVRNCPQKIIVPSAKGGNGSVSLDLSRGGCSYDCTRCSQVCPTGAIRALSLEEKRRTRIALAEFKPRNCLVFQKGVVCGRCAAACPTKAISLRKNGAPRPVNRKLCIGCGACQVVCPASPKAMCVGSVEKQTLIAKES